MTLSILTLCITLLALITFWLIQLKTEDAGAVDIYWGPGFAVIALIYALHASELSNLSIIFLFITIAWSARLGLHMALRHGKSDKEDRRYAAMRQNGGPNFRWKSVITVYLLQAVLMWIIATPHHAALAQSSAINSSFNFMLFWIGFCLFMAGFVTETIADIQLSRFKSESTNEGKTMRMGLWSWSRHPNYFGEAVLWWGFGLCGYALSNQLWAFVGPALLTFLLLRVSGVTMLEKHLRPEKQGYDDYVTNTSAFIPLPPKTTKKSPA